jgi:hypothetical protein
MKIIVRPARDGWIWAFVSSNGKQTANNEVFATRYNAIRAAKAVVTSVLRRYDPRAYIEWKQVDGDKRVTLTFRRIG